MFTNEYLKNSFEWWQTYTQGYTAFLFDATQQTLDQSLALRESMGQLMMDSVKKSEALNARERAMALEFVNTFNIQTQTAADQAADMFKAASALLTTAPLSNWAVERATQLSQAAAADVKE